MKTRQFFAARIAVCFIAHAILYFPTSAISMSRLGTVKIGDQNGVPCFSIPENLETKNGLPLHGLFINELPKGYSNKLPISIWSFKANNPEKPPTLLPKTCILYGEIPAGTYQRSLEPLELFRVYSVSLRAKHDGSSMIAYIGKFCVKPTASGRTIVQVIAEGPQNEDSTFGDCKR